MAQAQDVLRIRGDNRPIVSKGMGTQEQLSSQSGGHYTVGKHFVGNDGFIYLVTNEIQVGDSIVAGTIEGCNCVKTDLVTEIEKKPDGANVYSTDDAASTDLADGDYIPFYDISASAKKKSLWSNIKSALGKIFAHQTDIAPVEDGTTLSQDYAIGEHFYHDGILCKAKTALEADTAWSSLVLDTNYEVAEDVTTQIGKAGANYVGTRVAWNQLSLAEKSKYKTMDFTDDFNGRGIDSTPTANSQNVVESGGVYSQIQALSNKKADKPLVITLPNVSTSKLSFTSSDVADIANVTANHVVIESVLSNPSIQTGNWTITTGSNSIIVSGSIASSGTTNLTLTLIEKA